MMTYRTIARRSMTAVLGLGLALAPVAAQAPLAAQPAVAWTEGRGARMEGKTHAERAMGKCVASVIGGALLGGLLGAAAGSTKKGLLIGTAVGAGVCALLMRAGAKKDKAMLREAQMAAANVGALQTVAWTGEDGAALNAVVTPSAMVPVVAGDKGAYRCRSDNRCLVGDTWVAYDTLLTPTGPALQTIGSQVQVLKCRRLATKLSVEGTAADNDADTVCLVGDTWVTGDKLNKRGIKDENVVIA